MIASGSTNLFQSTANELHSSGHLEVAECTLGKVITSGNTGISRCKEIEEIAASGAFALDASKVTGNVILSGHRPEISDSTIAGKLECVAKTVKISNASIGKIVVKPIQSYSLFEIFSWKTYSSAPQSIEQVIELSGKNCQIGSIVFEDGASGKVRLKNGAKAPTVSGAAVIA